MSLFPCAVVDGDQSPAAGMLAAALDPTLRVISGANVSLVICEPAGESPDPRDMIRWIAEFHRVLDIVPMQFGDCIAGEAEAHDLLARRSSQLQATLDSIRGKTEFGIRLTIPARSDLPGDAQRTTQTAAQSTAKPLKPGSDYLRNRASHYATEDGIPVGLATRVQAWLAGFDVPQMRARLEGPSSVIEHPAIYVLIPRQSADGFIDQYDKLAPALGIQSSLTGPWAPFNFVRGIDANG